MLQTKPLGEILPDQPAVFTVQLSNTGETSTDFDLSIDRRDNSRGLVILANGDTLTTNQHYEMINAAEAFDTDIEVYRGPVHYEYPPVQLQLKSRCDKTLVSTYELWTHELSDGTKVIRFARECPKLVLDGSLGRGHVTVNGNDEKEIALLVQNVEKSTRGQLGTMGSNADDTFDHVNIKWRKIGSQIWQEEPIDLASEDEWGFVHAVWDLSGMQDGDYEVMVESVCPNNPIQFRTGETKTSTVRLDTVAPVPFAFPSETDVHHVGDPLVFEYDEALDCSSPFGFKVDVEMTLEEGGTITFDSYSKKNVLVVCEDRMIGAQVDGTMVDLDVLLGNSIQITLSDVSDSSGNLAEDEILLIKYKKGGKKKNTKRDRRRLDKVTSIRVFQKNMVMTQPIVQPMDVRVGERLDSIEEKFGFEIEFEKERIEVLIESNMYLTILMVVLIILIGLILLLLFSGRRRSGDPLLGY